MMTAFTYLGFFFTNALSLTHTHTHTGGIQQVDSKFENSITGKCSFINFLIVFNLTFEFICAKDFYYSIGFVKFILISKCHLVMSLFEWNIQFCFMLSLEYLISILSNIIIIHNNLSVSIIHSIFAPKFFCYKARAPSSIATGVRSCPRRGFK